MSTTPGHATGWICLVCKTTKPIDEKGGLQYKLVRARVTPSGWVYDKDSGAKICVCSNCTILGEPSKES